MEDEIENGMESHVWMTRWSGFWTKPSQVRCSSFNYQWLLQWFMNIFKFAINHWQIVDLWQITNWVMFGLSFCFDIVFFQVDFLRILVTAAAAVFLSACEEDGYATCDVVEILQFSMTINVIISKSCFTVKERS